MSKATQLKNNTCQKANLFPVSKALLDEKIMMQVISSDLLSCQLFYRESVPRQ